MKPTLLAVAGAVLLAQPASDAVTLRAAAPVGSSHLTAIDLVSTLSGGTLEVTMNGSPVPSAYLPQLQLETRDERIVEVRETVEQGTDAGPTHVLRHYQTLSWTNDGSMSMDSGGHETEFPWTAAGDSELEGHTLALRHDGDDWTAKALDESLSTLPEGVEAPLDFAFLLPDEAVEKGSSWELEGDLFLPFFEPGGPLGFEFDPEAAEHLLPEVDERSTRGELRLEVTSIADGEMRAEISGELVKVTVGPGDLSQVPVADGTATDTTTTTVQVTGHLVWSLEGARLSELELAGELLEKTHTVRDPGQEGGDYESVFSVPGQYHLKVRCSANAEPVEASAKR